MSKKLITVIILSVFITAGFVLVTIGIIEPEQKKSEKNELPELTTETTVPKTANLYFSPPTITVNPNSSQTSQVDIMLNSGTTQVSGTQIILEYDPKVIKNIRVTKPGVSFFGITSNSLELFSDIDAENGRISYAVGIPQGGTPQQGTGKVATISFTIDKDAVGSATSLTFAPTTIVTKLGERSTILKEAAGLTILLNSSISYMHPTY